MNMQHQRGLTIPGFLGAIAGTLIVLLLSLRVVPAYIEYFKISHTLDKIASNAKENSNIRTPTDIRYAFQRQSEIDDINIVSSRDLKIGSSRDGFDVSVSYESRMPIVANMSLIIEFEKTVRVERRE